QLAQRGVPTIDADDIVHRALAAGTATSRAILREFGSGVLRGDGSINRQALGTLVFQNPTERRRLEALIHPSVYQSIRDWFASLKEPMAVASIPLLYETGHDRDFDVVIATMCEPSQQIERLEARGLSKPEAEQRLAAQLPAQEKADRADYVIWTVGPKTDTDRRVEELISALAKRS